MTDKIDWNDRRITKLCEECKGTGHVDDGPKFAGDTSFYDVPFAAGSPQCPTCKGRGRVLLGA